MLRTVTTSSALLESVSRATIAMETPRVVVVVVVVARSACALWRHCGWGRRRSFVTSSPQLLLSVWRTGSVVGWRRSSWGRGGSVVDSSGCVHSTVIVLAVLIGWFTVHVRPHTLNYAHVFLCNARVVQKKRFSRQFLSFTTHKYSTYKCFICQIPHQKTHSSWYVKFYENLNDFDFLWFILSPINALTVEDPSSNCSLVETPV